MGKPVGGEKRGRPFPPGVSGNPTGRPRVVSALLARFRDSCSLEDMDALYRGLFEIATEAADMRARVSATHELLDRLIGKPVQSLEVTTGGSEVPAYDLSRLTVEELRAYRNIMTKISVAPSSADGERDAGEAG